MEHLKLSAANLDRQVGCLHSQLQSAESMSERAAAEAAELANERDRARASANDIALRLRGAERELEEATSERLALVEKHRVDHEAAMQAAEQHKGSCKQAIVAKLQNRSLSADRLAASDWQSLCVVVWWNPVSAHPAPAW